MKTQTKRVDGKLLDKTNKTHLVDALVHITLRDSQNPNDRPQYEIQIVVDGYRPELADKSHILNLKDKVSGEVFITISGIPGEQTQYTCFLQDANWNNVDWFQAL